jgi:hypothetical protein
MSTKLGRLWFHVDSGANVFAVSDKSWLYYFVPQRLPYKDVNGLTRYSAGFGIALIRFLPYGPVYPIGPVYVNSSAPRNSFSLSALCRFCGFKDATESMLKACTFVDFLGKKTIVPCSHHNGLDFLDLEILHLDSSLSAEPPPSTICQLTVKSRSSLSDIQRLQEAHLRLGHPSFESLIQMSKNNLLLDLPSIRKHHPVLCNACFRHNRTHVHKNPPDKSTPPIFTKIGCDFTFYSHLSLRGHNSAFTCVDHTSRYPFAFPTCAKRPPIVIMQFFVGCLRNMGFNPTVFKMDEGGELCKSTEFCKALIDMNLIIQSTGGDNKTSNGRVEVFHRTLHQMNRSTLATLETLLPAPLPKGITAGTCP